MASQFLHVINTAVSETMVILIANLSGQVAQISLLDQNPQPLQLLQPVRQNKERFNSVNKNRTEKFKSKFMHIWVDGDGKKTTSTNKMQVMKENITNHIPFVVLV